jgi:hypothetical protein
MSILVSAQLDKLMTAICFWTVFTSLGLQLFYWSVWKLGEYTTAHSLMAALSGSELALLANLSPYILLSTSCRRYFTSKEGLLHTRAVMVAFGLGCYFATPTVRLLGVSIGTSAGWLALAGNWARLKGSKEMLAEGKGVVGRYS